ncbi:hypothetical protein AB9P05_11595 [Roseivirga sp. BDSF3-8]|uniref:hypothetical protein n=1 Tax=Roseivirga sp. BDSF3-8 TaxID=3241598 RepID=UPI00353212BF
MKKDISFKPVENVILAVAREQNEGGQLEWRSYIINKNSEPLETVLIITKGYGEKDGQPQKTSTLRHMIDRLEGGSYAMIEPVDEAVFHLSNEFWVSYYVNGQIYDKKFIFVPGSFDEENVGPIPELDLEGITHS